MQAIQIPANSYNVLNQENILEIIHDLASKHELSLKFSGVGEGADHWKNALTFNSEGLQSLLPDYVPLLETLQQHIGNRPTSVIDLGPGSGQQSEKLIQFLLSNKQLHKYIGVDISQRMLELADDHIFDVTGGHVEMVRYIRDFTEDSMDDIFDDRSLGGGPRIFLMLGGTLDSQPSSVEALRKISQYVRPGDLLFYDIRLPLDQSSFYKPVELSLRRRFLLDLLGITKDMYDAERVYDEPSHTEIRQIIPHDDISLSYEINGETKTIILKQGEPINVWRYHYTTVEETTANLKQGGFAVAAHTGDKYSNHVLFLCERQKLNS